MRRLVDLTHPVEHGMITYPGLPGPEIGTHLSRAESAAHYPPGTEFHIGRISMISNTGTYLDAPSHRFAEGVDLVGLALESTADLDGIVVNATGRAIGPPAGFDGGGDAVGWPAGDDVRGRAVLLRTGWSRHWRTEAYAVDAPFLTAEGARWLVEHGAALVGIDSVNIDDIADLARPAHTRLLCAGIPVLEHLRNLHALPSSGFRLHAAPVPVRGLGTFPVRAYAVVDG